MIRWFIHSSCFLNRKKLDGFNSEYFNHQVTTTFFNFKIWSVCLTTALSWFSGETASSTAVLSLASMGVWKQNTFSQANCCAF